MLEIAIVPGSYLHLVVSFKVGKSSFRYTLPKISLLFDTVHYFGKAPEIELLKTDPYGQLSDISDELLKLVGKYPYQSEENVKDLRKALGDPPNAEGGYYAYSIIRALLAYAKQKSCFLYVLPGLREEFIEFCVKYEPDYLPIIKKGFLFCSIIEYIFDSEISAFEPIEAQQALAYFKNYKEDLQKGFLDYLDQFSGHYMLSEHQERYIREHLAREENKLLEFLKPENLRKFNVNENIRDFFLGLLPYPLDTIYDTIKEVKEMRDFRKANLDFILSIALLKQISNIGGIEEAAECYVCALSPAEIEKMSEKESDDFLLKNLELCTEHIVARLDLRKRFGLHGKRLLKEMKRLGDLSVFIPEKKRDSE